MRRILVAEEDDGVRSLIGPIIAGIGDLDVESARSGTEALTRARVHVPQLIVCDSEAGDSADGRGSLVRMLRADGLLGRVPILVVSRFDDLQHKYAAFADGCDDYVVRPFDPLELQFRVKALLRRSTWAELPPCLELGDLKLDEGRYVVFEGAKEVALTPSEFAILRVLMYRPHQIVRVETLLTEALGYPSGTGNPQVIHTHIKNLRGKLELNPAKPERIMSNR
ncbi:MAG: response regulator transcription factor, partial [Candidatus Sericytochromatia bacterium]|nr:response regulator transcription factor [Candidatus Tanganyikabacteria bacterium]